MIRILQTGLRTSLKWIKDTIGAADYTDGELHEMFKKASRGERFDKKIKPIFAYVGAAGLHPSSLFSCTGS